MSDAKAYPHFKPDAAWLATRQEAALEPELEIVDAHHHIWDRPGERYLLDEFGADVKAGHRVTGSVFLQCAFSYRTEGPAALKPVGETERIAAMADEAAVKGLHVCQGIVGYADLRLGAAVEAVLDAHIAAGKGRFKGIRQSAAQDDSILSTMSTNPPPKLMADPAFRDGFRVLARKGLIYDAWIYHPQIPELADLADAFPDAKIVIDHCGGRIGVGRHATDPRATLARWRTDIRELARRPNVYVKLGGLARPVCGATFRDVAVAPDSETLAAAWRGEIGFCIEAFGPRRAMFESNFPVDMGMCGYVPLWNAFKKIAALYSPAEKAEMFAGTARRFYGLA